MWRIHRDETNFTKSDIIVWDYVLPYDHVPILPSDCEQVKRLKKYLDENFTAKALHDAADYIKDRPNRMKHRKILLQDLSIKGNK